ncbi:MAG: hypothetical protein K2L09_05730 [Alistipes sp.]|nr:hypothetical protein [Alistipes sp.]
MVLFGMVYNANIIKFFIFGLSDPKFGQKESPRHLSPPPVSSRPAPAKPGRRLLLRSTFRIFDCVLDTPASVMLK